MKKNVFTVAIILGTTIIAIGQKYDDVKNLMILQQYDKAKEMVDKNWSNPKYLTKPEAYILKSTIYSTIGNMPDKGAAGIAMVEEGDKLYQEYLKQDAKKTLIMEPAYTNTPIILYTNYINRGIGLYNNKDYKGALGLFEKSLYYSGFLNENKIAVMPLDTTGEILAGAAAQNIGDEEHDKIAMVHYKKLADAKVAGEDGVTIYRFLARKSFDYEDIPSFNKYMELGKELYPKEEFFTYVEEDFLFSIENQEEKIARIRKKLAVDPENFKVQSAYGEYIFDQLNPKETDAVLPANSEELEKEMVTAFEKAAAIQPESPLAFMNLANHFMNKSIRTQNALADHQKMMRDKQKANTPEPVKGKPAPKPAPPEPADVEKRKELQAKYEMELAASGKYYESSVNIYSKDTELTNMEKQNYRNAVSYLIDINKELKNAAIRDKKAADEAKFTAAEKKYMDLYAALNK
jgi:tetratricopeptide (TPR) repeat protein